LNSTPLAVLRLNPISISTVSRGSFLDKQSADLQAKEAQINALERRVAELEAENRRLWAAMRSTGELLGRLLHPDD
jgi:hypothetical protein